MAMPLILEFCVLGQYSRCTIESAAVPSLPALSWLASLLSSQLPPSATPIYVQLQKTLKEDNEGEDDSWTDSERKLAQNALGLAKVTHVCVRWLKEAVRKAGPTAPSHQLDMAASVASTVSPALDDFVSELYHPVDFPSVYETAEKLVGVLRSLLTMVRESHFAAAFSSENINKIEQFISHNHQKVDPSVSPVPQLANLSLNSSHVTGSMCSHPLPSHNPPSCIVLDMDICDVCGKVWPQNDQHFMKPNVKKEKEPGKEKKTVAADVSPAVPPTPPPASSRPHPHTRTTDVIVVMFLATFLLFYLLIKDWLLIAINGVLLCLYVLFIRRRLPIPAYGTSDLVEYLNKIS